MKRKGSILLEVILGICFIGLLSTICLPTMTRSLSNFKNINEIYEETYIAESIVEVLKSPSDNSKILIDRIYTEGLISYDGDQVDIKDFTCDLILLDSSEGLIEVAIKVYNNKGNDKYVEYKATFPR